MYPHQPPRPPTRKTNDFSDVNSFQTVAEKWATKTKKGFSAKMNNNLYFYIISGNRENMTFLPSQSSLSLSHICTALLQQLDNLNYISNDKLVFPWYQLII